MAPRPSQPKERTVYCFMSSVPAARKWIWRLVVICAGVNATYIIFAYSVPLWNKNLDLYMSVTRAWIPPPVGTLPRLRPCNFCGSLGSSLPRLLGRNVATSSEEGTEDEPLASRHICNNFDGAATDTLTPHFPVYSVAQKTTTSRIDAMRSAAVGSLCMRRHADGLPPTEVPASPPPRLAVISSVVGTHRRDSPKPTFLAGIIRLTTCG